MNATYLHVAFQESDAVDVFQQTISVLEKIDVSFLPCSSCRVVTLRLQFLNLDHQTVALRRHPLKLGRERLTVRAGRGFDGSPYQDTARKGDC